MSGEIQSVFVPPSCVHLFHASSSIAGALSLPPARSSEGRAAPLLRLPQCDSGARVVGPRVVGRGGRPR